MSDPNLLNALTLTVAIEHSERFDHILLGELRRQNPEAAEGLSRTALKTFFKTNQVLVNGKPASPSVALPPGNYAVTLLGWNKLQNVLIPATWCFLPIVYEDPDILVLHKASGVPSVSLTGSENTTAAAAALARVPTLVQLTLAKPLEPGLLHRLDTDTSGLLAFAKSDEEFLRLREAWKTQAVRKTYRAMIELSTPSTNLPFPQTLHDPIGRLADSAKRMLVCDGSSQSEKNLRGKPLPAVTHITQIKQISEFRFDLEIEIETGVMHQIRAHLAHYGWPIVGDRIYNKKTRSQLNSAPDRLMLHAWKLQLPLKDGQVLQLDSMLPHEWTR